MRPRLLIVAVFTALLVPAAEAAAFTIADPGQIDVSRRVDPTLDNYMRTEQPLTPFAALNTNQRWLSTHARPLVLHDSDPTVSLNITGWATKPKVAAYINGTGVNPYRKAQRQGAKKWLVKVRGKQVMVDGWEMIDLRQPAARRWWLYGTDGKASCHPDRDERGALDLYACGYSSLWIDNALTTIYQGFTPKPKISDKSWGRGVLTLLSTLRRVKPAGTTFTINMHWTDSDFGYAKKPRLKAKSPLVRSAKFADQVIIEGGAIDPGLFYPSSVKHPWSYRRLLAFSDALHKQKVKVQWEKTSSDDLTAKGPRASVGKVASCLDRDYGGKPWLLGSTPWKGHVRSAAFNYASALLTFAPGDSVGDMCEYPGRGWLGYEAHLGTPVARRVDRGALITRDFTAGAIAVNASDKPAKYMLPAGKQGVDLAQLVTPLVTTPVSSVTIPARSAAVVEYR